MSLLPNKEQKEAIEHIDGPLLALAGAGSGKTRVITERIAYLIKKGIYPNNILAVTFTNKAAAEMRERIVLLLKEKPKGLIISTFHSFCLRVLKAEINKLGYINNFTIYGGWEFSYNTVGNSPQIFRLHTGFDYRLPLYKEINFITGINLAVILDEKDNLGLIRIRENLHAAINLAAGIEFYRFAIALKFGYGKPRGASSYFGYESKIGAEISLLF